MVQPFTLFSIASSMPGHQTWLRATIFIFSIPGCVSCSTLNTAGLSDVGTTIRQPHNTQLSCTEHSSSRHENALQSADSGRRFPDHKASRTVDTMASLFVACATAAADNNDGNAFSSMNTSPATWSLNEDTGSGSRLSPSAFPRLTPGRYTSR
uniref:Putative secreted protein n=1 Tax=Ixodes ricinus TaxID=34613 RepID=A0A6B0UVE5_IXORI